VSLSGNNALVGANHSEREDEGNVKNPGPGAAYYYTGLNNATETQTETIKLVASDPANGASFGTSVSLDGGNALIGAPGAKGNNNNVSIGAAYYYTGLNSITGSGNPDKTEIVKFMASAGVANDHFGNSVSLSGSRFVIGAKDADSATGKSYAGDIRAFTTLDETGGVTLSTAGLSFVSQNNWIIGDNRSKNVVILNTGDSATVAAEKAVYIGKSKGASNTLVVEGELTTKEIHIGSDSSQENSLIVNGKLALKLPSTDTAKTTILLHRGNYLIIWNGPNEDGGDVDSPLTPEAVALALETANVQLKAGRNPAERNVIDQYNAAEFISTSAGTELGLVGYTIVSASGGAGGTPEPSTYALWGGALLAGLIFLHRRRKQK
jgi:MYXO-CTERM domain-containing protein